MMMMMVMKSCRKLLLAIFQISQKHIFAEACKHELKRDALIAHNFSSFLFAIRFFPTAFI